MKRTEAKTVGEIINQLLRQQQLDDKLLQNRACQLWPVVMGRGIDNLTSSVTARGGVMTVAVTSAPLRNELLLLRASIIQRINEQLGSEVIHEIIFR